MATVVGAGAVAGTVVNACKIVLAVEVGWHVAAAVAATVAAGLDLGKRFCVKLGLVGTE